MKVEYVDFKWTFDKEALHEDVKAWCARNEVTQVEAYGMIGLSPSWSQPRPPMRFPTVANLIEVCSFMDLDPRDYFKLDV